MALSLSQHFSQRPPQKPCLLSAGSFRLRNRSPTVTKLPLCRSSVLIGQFYMLAVSHPERAVRAGCVWSCVTNVELLLCLLTAPFTGCHSRMSNHPRIQIHACKVIHFVYKKTINQETSFTLLAVFFWNRKPFPSEVTPTLWKFWWISGEHLNVDAILVLS